MKKQVMIFFAILVILIALVTIVFFFMNNNPEDNNLVSKTEEEIEYLEEKIIAIMNSLNQINFSNTVLVEEKTETKSENTQSSGNTQGIESGGGSQGQNSENGSNSGSSQFSSGGQNNKETTKYEIKNDSILAKESNTIDWEYVKTNIETIHLAWATLTIDLHSLNVNNEDILNFSRVLDQATIDAKGENKIALINNLSSLYSFLPNYRKEISEDSNKINTDFAKASVLNSYAFAEQDKWDEMKAQVNSAIVYFTNILNSVNEEQENQNKMSKIYVMLNELNNSIDSKDKDLYMIKYRNVMEELVNF